MNYSTYRRIVFPKGEKTQYPQPTSASALHNQIHSTFELIGTDLHTMQPSAPFRRIVLSSLTALLLSVVAVPHSFGQFHRRGGYFRASMQPGQRGHASPRQAPPPHPNQQRAAQKQEHLDTWMKNHSNMTPEQQQHALENEPGFRNLPPQTQQRLRNSLAQLNRMPPEQRRREVERNEAIEHLTPAQRQQFSTAMGQFNILPIDRRRMVARAFRDLREMPPPQREALLNSDRTRSEFSNQERSTLSGLLAAEPYIPAQTPNGTVNSGK
jgi:Protein of unknown function (DUF3106)